MNKQILNYYGEPATHDDCIHNFDANCDGVMVQWININTGNSMLMCWRHAWRADNRQYKIKAEYLHDGIHDEDY